MPGSPVFVAADQAISLDFLALVAQGACILESQRIVAIEEMVFASCHFLGIS